MELAHVLRKPLVVIRLGTAHSWGLLLGFGSLLLLLLLPLLTLLLVTSPRQGGVLLLLRWWRLLLLRVVGAYEAGILLRILLLRIANLLRIGVVIRTALARLAGVLLLPVGGLSLAGGRFAPDAPYHTTDEIAEWANKAGRQAGSLNRSWAAVSKTSNCTSSSSSNSTSSTPANGTPT